VRGISTAGAIDRHARDNIIVRGVHTHDGRWCLWLTLSQRWDEVHDREVAIEVQNPGWVVALAAFRAKTVTDREYTTISEAYVAEHISPKPKSARGTLLHSLLMRSIL
jgi:hypothetical protein